MTAGDEAARRLDDLLEAVESRLDRLEESVASEPAAAAPAVERPAPSGEPASGHVLFVPAPTGYKLVPREGAPPERGAIVELDEGARFAVVKVVQTTSPDDGRPCAYLERAS